MVQASGKRNTCEGSKVGDEWIEGASRKQRRCEELKLDDELRGMILKGILDDLGEYRLTERLASSVVTTESGKVNFHIRDQAIQFQERDHLYILHPGTEMEAKFPISVSGLWGKYFNEFDAEAIIRRYFKVWAESPRKDYFSVI